MATEVRAMELFTIGFTQTSAERFFGRLIEAKVARVIDVRLANTSQLAGFAKAPDLEYFLRALGGIGYVHEPLLAPTREILDEYKKHGESWSWYEERFLALLRERNVAEKLDRELFDRGCLLCSEATADRCHRRLAAEYLVEQWGDKLRLSHL